MKQCHESRNETYSISELAREFTITTRTIRFYEDRGLLSPDRDAHNRVYHSRDRVRLGLILRGKRLGFSLREVAEMLDMYDAPEGEAGQVRYFVAQMRARRDILMEQRADIDNVLVELVELEERCQEILAREEPAAGPA